MKNAVGDIQGSTYSAHFTTLAIECLSKKRIIIKMPVVANVVRPFMSSFFQYGDSQDDIVSKFIMAYLLDVGFGCDKVEAMFGSDISSDVALAIRTTYDDVKMVLKVYYPDISTMAKMSTGYKLMDMSKELYMITFYNMESTLH